jgi:hypothetical protein
MTNDLPPSYTEETVQSLAWTLISVILNMALAAELVAVILVSGLVFIWVKRAHDDKQYRRNCRRLDRKFRRARRYVREHS